MNIVAGCTDKWHGLKGVGVSRRMNVVAGCTLQGGREHSGKHGRRMNIVAGCTGAFWGAEE